MTSILEAKIDEMLAGATTILSDAQCDELIPYRVGNFFCTRPNPAQVGILDEWIGWINRRALETKAAVAKKPVREYALEVVE
jgi:hypothetical protein